MGDIHEPRRVLLLVAAFSRHPPALEWARAEAERVWGPVSLASEAFDFVETEYYESSMGAGLKKIFWAFERLADPGDLVEIKRQTNEREASYAKDSPHEEDRPLNLDPGYLSEAKLVLASTKDHAHRIYLARGIYAEVTLHYRSRRWQKSDWTFPDYQRDDYQQFFTECREYLRRRLREG